MSTKEAIEMDESHHTYLNRVAKLTLPATYESQIKNVQESPKFKLSEDGVRAPVPFPGYSIVAPPYQDDPDNQSFYRNLIDCQQELAKRLEPDLLVSVNPDSFHITFADLIWDSALHSAIASTPDFEQKLCDRVRDSFELYAGSLAATAGEQPTPPGPVKWQVMGFTVRPRAIEVSLVPKDTASYQRVLNLRRAIYQSSNLIRLGIEQQYYFTAHVTLAYFGNVDRSFDRIGLCDILQDYNMRWIDTPQEMVLTRAELRKFTDMSNYYREPNWPSVNL
jgi:hypothetical protein